MLYDIALSISLMAKSKATETKTPTVISQTNYNTMYYSAAQQLAHHASSGCAMRTGDLLGSGTISGPEPGTYGSMLELTWNGAHPLTLECGQQRRFVETGDSVTLQGHAQGDGYRIGFGSCEGTILPPVHIP